MVPSKARTVTLAMGLAILTRASCVGLVDYRYDVGDAASYLAAATTLAEHGVYSSDATPPYTPTAYRPPGYAALLALSRLIVPSLSFALALQQVLSLLSIVVVMVVAGRLAPESRTYVAVLAALNPFDAVYASALLSECLTGLLVICAVWMLSRGPGLGALIGAGVSAGLLCLTRDVYLPMIPFCALAWLALGRPAPFSARARQVGIVCLAATLTILPWTARNARHFGRVIPVSAGRLGYSLWLGTWAITGDFTANDALGLPRAYPDEAFDSEDQRARIEGGDQDIAKADATFRAVFWEKLRAAPIKVVWVWLKRAPRLWLSTRFDIFDLNHSVLPRGSVSWTVFKVLLLAVDAALLALAAVGAVVALHRRSPLVWLVVPLAFTTLVYLPLNAFESRYSQPMMLLLDLLAGFALGQLALRSKLSLGRPAAPP